MRIIVVDYMRAGPIRERGKARCCGYVHFLRHGNKVDAHVGQDHAITDDYEVHRARRNSVVVAEGNLPDGSPPASLLSLPPQYDSHRPSRCPAVVWVSGTYELSDGVKEKMERVWR